MPTLETNNTTPEENKPLSKCPLEGLSLKDFDASTKEEAVKRLADYLGTTADPSNLLIGEKTTLKTNDKVWVDVLSVINSPQKTKEAFNVAKEMMIKNPQWVRISVLGEANGLELSVVDGSRRFPVSVDSPHVLLEDVDYTFQGNINVLLPVKGLPLAQVEALFSGQDKMKHKLEDIWGMTVDTFSFQDQTFLRSSNGKSSLLWDPVKKAFTPGGGWKNAEITAIMPGTHTMTIRDATGEYTITLVSNKDPGNSTGIGYSVEEPSFDQRVF